MLFLQHTMCGSLNVQLCMLSQMVWYAEEWNKAMDQQDQVILRERNIMRSTQDYIGALRAGNATLCCKFSPCTELHQQLRRRIYSAGTTQAHSIKNLHGLLTNICPNATWQMQGHEATAVIVTARAC